MMLFSGWSTATRSGDWDEEVDLGASAVELDAGARDVAVPSGRHVVSALEELTLGLETGILAGHTRVNRLCAHAHVRACSRTFASHRGERFNLARTRPI